MVGTEGKPNRSPKIFGRIKLPSHFLSQIRKISNKEEGYEKLRLNVAVQKISEGRFGIVYKTILENKKYALKYYKTENTCCYKSFLQEAKIFKYIGEHANIVNIESINIDIKNLVLVSIMNYYEFNLSKWLKINMDCGIEKKLYVFGKIVNGVAYLHEKGLVHRDLKPENILINDKEVKSDYEEVKRLKNHSNIRKTEQDYNIDLRIGDFGASRKMYGYMTPSVVTWYYRDPALYDKKKTNYRQEIDIWSLGIIFLEIMGIADRCLPAKGEDFQDKEKFFHRIKSFFGNRDELKERLSVFFDDLVEEKDLHSMFVDFIMGMLNIAPDKRIDIKECSSILEVITNKTASSY